MEKKRYFEEFFLIRIDYLKRILYLYSGLTIVLLFLFFLNDRKEDIPIVCILLINLISLYMFLGYSRVSISRELFNIIKFHLIFLISLSFVGILKIDLSFLSEMLLFDCGRSIAENIYIFSTVPICIILISKKICNSCRSIVIKYIIAMALLALLNFFNNKLINTQHYMNVLFYIIDSILLISILILFRCHEIKRKNYINIVEIIILIFFLLDVISIATLKIPIIISTVNIIKFICLNIFLSHFTTKTVKLSNRILFKDMHSVNNNLEIINYTISEKNCELLDTREELEEANRVYRDFIKMVNIPIVIVDGDNKRINFCNNEFVNITKNNNIKNIINKKINKFINFQDGEKVLQNLKNGQVVLGYMENSGEVKLFEIDFVLLSERNNDILLLLDDITKKKNTERIKAELEKIQKNEKIKNNFLSSISHDLKTPIGIIDSAVQLHKVFLKKNDFESISKYNNVCKENCIYLTRLTNNLIDISKISEKLLEPNFIVDNIVPFLESKVEIISEYANLSNIKVVFDTDEEDIFVKYDKELMERVILNLLSNSIKYTDEGGLIEVNVLATDDEIKIEFCDSGRGMTDDFIKEAFNIYSMENYSDIKKNKSSGIGLFVVYNLVEIQQGKIKIESQLGKGSKFVITFKRELIYESIY